LPKKRPNPKPKEVRINPGRALKYCLSARYPKLITMQKKEMPSVGNIPRIIPRMPSQCLCPEILMEFADDIKPKTDAPLARPKNHGVGKE
jgi:hypothetical protein